MRRLCNLVNDVLRSADFALMLDFVDFLIGMIDSIVLS